MIKQFRKKLHYFRAGKTLQEHIETAEHITCTPAGTLSNHQQSYLCLSHCCTGKSQTSPQCSAPGRHMQPCATGTARSEDTTSCSHKAQRAHLIFPCLLFIPKADFYLLVLSEQHTPETAVQKLITNKTTELHLEDDFKSGCYQINKLSGSPKA